jgi:hypothetical protein
VSRKKQCGVIVAVDILILNQHAVLYDEGASYADGDSIRIFVPVTRYQEKCTYLSEALPIYPIQFIDRGL